MVGYSDPPGKERKHVFGQSSIVVLFKVTVKFVYFFFFSPSNFTQAYALVIWRLV